jgi:hypothetical protein
MEGDQIVLEVDEHEHRMICEALLAQIELLHHQARNLEREAFQWEQAARHSHERRSANRRAAGTLRQNAADLNAVVRNLQDAMLSLSSLTPPTQDRTAI